MNDSSGNSWTEFDSIANAIDRSHACNGGMVVLVTTDGEDFMALRAELCGICEDLKYINNNVYEYTHRGDLGVAEGETPSPAWAIQLTMV